jgi:hypothetical protein
MLTAAKALVGTAKSAGLLPAFGWVVLVVALLAASGGTWLGVHWERGAQAIVDVAALKQQAKADRDYIDDLKANGDKLRQYAADVAKAQGDAISRQAEIATRLEDTLDAQRTFTVRQQGELADLLARRPDLRNLRLGDDVLQHWNESNAGRPAAGGAAAPAARPASQPAAPVPDRAPAGAQRPHPRPAGESRPGGGALSRLQRAAERPAGLDRRVGAHGARLVLRRARSRRLGRCAMPGFETMTRSA